MVGQQLLWMWKDPMSAHWGLVEVIQGDITRVRADAIVNAANEELAAGSGVCGAIFRASGYDLLGEACARHGRCETGGAVATPAFGISTARIIVHAVGPVFARYSPAEAARLLRKAYASAIEVAIDEGCKSIAFPAIATGIYGYPLEAACREAVDVCLMEAERAGLHIKLVAFDDVTFACLQTTLESAS